MVSKKAEALQIKTSDVRIVVAVNRKRKLTQEESKMDELSLSQGKYPWGIIKNRKLNSKFVKCSKGGVPKQNALYFYDCKEMWVNFNRAVELYQKI